MFYVPRGGSADRCPPDRHIVALIGVSSIHIDGTEFKTARFFILWRIARFFFKSKFTGGNIMLKP